MESEPAMKTVVIRLLPSQRSYEDLVHLMVGPELGTSGLHRGAGIVKVIHDEDVPFAIVRDPVVDGEPVGKRVDLRLLTHEVLQRGSSVRRGKLHDDVLEDWHLEALREGFRNLRYWLPWPLLARRHGNDEADLTEFRHKVLLDLGRERLGFRKVVSILQPEQRLPDF